MGFSFYDIPWLGQTVKDVKDGNYGTAVADAATFGLYSPAKNYFFDDPANNIKAAYDKALGDVEGNKRQMMDFYLGQQQKAQGFYKPLQEMFSKAYGGGIQGPQVPKAPGVSLASLYGGGR
jgi:hypothetical protein